MEVCKMKNKSVDLRTLWERKVQKLASTSTPQLVTKESEVQIPVPLVQAVTTESQVVQNRSTEHETYCELFLLFNLTFLFVM
ncbi:unnamed protein product [Urochloa humidicola]